MYPTISVLGLELHTYGLMMVLGASLGITCSAGRAKQKGISAEQEFLFLLHALIGGIVGAKFLYLLPRIQEFWTYRSEIFQTFDSFIAYIGGGFVFYGGLIGGLAAAALYCRYYKEPFMTMIEIAVPFIPLMHGIGRIGCFLTGCCYGIPSTHYGIAFSISQAAPNGIPLFPVQLAEACVNFILCVVLVLYTQKERAPLTALGLYLSCYAVARFLLEFLRYDSARGVYFFLSTSQWISLITLPIGIFLLTGNRRIIKGLQSSRWYH